ncbi:MAG: hypothetical protein HOQ02_10325 [Lysobacter sp.]|nr:hypothetical protein [Lysobacter sp.]
MSRYPTKKPGAKKAAGKKKLARKAKAKQAAKKILTPEQRTALSEAAQGDHDLQGVMSAIKLQRATELAESCLGGLDALGLLTPRRTLLQRLGDVIERGFARLVGAKSAE